MNQHTRRLWWVAAAALAACAGAPAFAQEADKQDDPVKGDFREPLSATKARERARQAEARARELEAAARDRIVSRLSGVPGENITMMENGPDGKYELRISNGKMSARIDGEELPADRIRREGDTVELLGKDGQVVKRFELPEPPRATMRWGQPFDALRMLGSPRAPGEAAQPRVMIGVTIADIDRERLREMGVDREGGVLIEDVIEGLPAEKAGIKPQDVVVAINGRPIEDQGEFRERLQANNPDDEVSLTIVRGGKEEQIKVKLQAFDGDRLGNRWTAPEAPEGDEWSRLFQWDGDDWRDQVEEALREAMEAVREAEGDWKDVKADVLKHLESAMAEVEKAGRQIRGFRNLFIPGDGRGIVITPAPPPPAPPTPGQADAPEPAPSPRPRGNRGNASADQMERILQQLEKMNERLDRLEKEKDGR